MSCSRSSWKGVHGLEPEEITVHKRPYSVVQVDMEGDGPHLLELINPQSTWELSKIILVIYLYISISSSKV